MVQVVAVVATGAAVRHGIVDVRLAAADAVTVTVVPAGAALQDLALSLVTGGVNNVPKVFAVTAAITAVSNTVHQVPFAAVKRSAVAVAVAAHTRIYHAFAPFTGGHRVGKLAGLAAAAAMVHVKADVRFTAIVVESVAIAVTTRTAGDFTGPLNAGSHCIPILANLPATAAVVQISTCVGFATIRVNPVAVAVPTGAFVDLADSLHALTRGVEHLADIAATAAVVQVRVDIYLAAVVIHTVAIARAGIADDLVGQEIGGQQGKIDYINHAVAIEIIGRAGRHGGILSQGRPDEQQRTEQNNDCA